MCAILDTRVSTIVVPYPTTRCLCVYACRALNAARAREPFWETMGDRFLSILRCSGHLSCVFRVGAQALSTQASGLTWLVSRQVCIKILSGTPEFPLPWPLPKC